MFFARRIHSTPLFQGIFSSSFSSPLHSLHHISFILLLLLNIINMVAAAAKHEMSSHQ
jgi:hypothetical protein